MNIVINAVLFHEKPRGVGRYFNNLLPEIAKQDKDNQYYVVYGKWMRQYDFLRVKQSNIHFVCLNIPKNKIMRNLYLSIILPLKIKKFKPDLFHQIDTSPILVKTCRLVSTIHDLAEFEVPEKYSRIQSMARKIYVKGQIKRSDVIITVSEYSRKDIQKRFKISEERIVVVPESSSSNLLPSANKPKCENYLLFVGEVERTKNLESILLAFDMIDKELKDKFQIHVVGRKGNAYKDCMDIIKNKKLQDKVVFYDYVTDDKLLSIYEKAYVFVFASFFEGFGLPVLEAMTLGVPVICSNATSIPEVGGNAVLTFNPGDVDDLKDKLQMIMRDSSLRDKMIRDGLERAEEFTAGKCAKMTIEVYNKTVKKNE